MKTSTMLKSAVAAGAFAVAGVTTANADTITVQAGDTLSKLARANGTTVDALAKANGISNPNLIFVGQQLQTEGTANATVPAQPATTQQAASAPAAKGTYTVKAGDTLNRIAAANGTSVAALAAANGIQNIHFITVGQVLSLSGTAQPAQPAQPAVTNTDPAISVMLNSLNALRTSLGLKPVTLDAGLSAKAYARAVNAVANGGLPVNHFKTSGEVVAIQFPFDQVISAWYNETNMITNGVPAHRMWVTNPYATSVGFGVVGDTIVAVSSTK